MGDIALLREQRRANEDRIQILELQVRDLHSHVDRLVAAAHDKDRENSELWEQLRRVTEEYRAELIARDTTIAALSAEGDALRALYQQHCLDSPTFSGSDASTSD